MFWAVYGYLFVPEGHGFDDESPLEAVSRQKRLYNNRSAVGSTHSWGGAGDGGVHFSGCRGMDAPKC